MAGMSDGEWISIGEAAQRIVIRAALRRRPPISPSPRRKPIGLAARPALKISRLKGELARGHG